MLNHHGVTFLQIRKPHICTEEDQRKTTSSCGTQEKNTLFADDFTSNNHLVTTFSDAAQRLAVILQTSLPSGLSLADCGPMVSANACIQFC